MRYKTQNTKFGCSFSFLTESFAITKEKNSKTGLVTYYGTINDIIELDYYGHL